MERGGLRTPPGSPRAQQPLPSNGSIKHGDASVVHDPLLSAGAKAPVRTAPTCMACARGQQQTLLFRQVLADWMGAAGLRCEIANFAICQGSDAVCRSVHVQMLLTIRLHGLIRLISCHAAWLGNALPQGSSLDWRCSVLQGLDGKFGVMHPITDNEA